MKNFFLPLILAAALIFAGCDSAESDPPKDSDIPPDPTNVTVPEPTINNIQPTGTITPSNDNPSRIQVNLTGLINPVTNAPITLFYNPENPGSSNIFITEDGTVKGLKVTKVGSGTVLTADVVFVVDNSGSMFEEADSVASSIIEFANFLQASGLNVQFAVVGYDGPVTGAVNFTSAQAISDYLNRSTGISRTRGFAGPDSAAVHTKAKTFASGVFGENGAMAVLFADSTFSWRTGAQRVFINFTDESTQPGNQLFWTTALMCGLIGGKATVHTVYSGPADTSSGLNGSWSQFHERPWEMSLCTGGTIIFIPQDATGLNLKNLPVAGALANSYLVEYKAGSTGKTHTVIITIKETNADGKRQYEVVY